MNRHRTYTAQDEAPAADGDGSFRGLNMRLDPGQLQAGLVAGARNKRFTDGSAATRKGIRKLSWSAPGYSGYDPGAIVPYGVVAGAGVFNDPITGDTWIILATRAGVWKARPGTTGSLVPMPAGEPVPSRVRLVQTYNGMVMLRGADLEPLYLADIDAGFQTLPEPDVPGNVKVPNALFGVYAQNRLVIVDPRTDPIYVDTVWISDFGTVTDVLEGPAAYNSFKINQGSADRLRAVYPFNATTWIAAKEASIYLILNVAGTNAEVAANAYNEEFTTEYGTTSPLSFVNVGKDVWFMAGRRGIVSIQQSAQGILQGLDVPVSDAIEPLIARINWQYAENITAAFQENKVYFAVPLDDATKLGPELAGGPPPTWTGFSTVLTAGIVTGATYKWVPGANESGLVNGTQTITAEGVFEAQGTSVTVTHAPGAPRTATLKRIWQGYCNAVLVFDTRTGQWAGHDDSEAIMVRDWLRFPVN